MISIENLRFKYPQSDFQLEIDELCVGAGSKVAIVGPSGSGKTTLLNLICGISVPQLGRVIIEDTIISQLPDSTRRDFRIQNIGMVFQQFELVDYLNTTDNIMLPYFVNRSLAKRVPLTTAAVAIAENIGLADKLRRFPGQLSQGEQQRVAICRAMVTNPKLILADEPTGNLDPKNKTKILNLLFDQCANGQKTLVVVTHDMNILDGFDRIIDFEQFRMERSGDGLD